MSIFYILLLFSCLGVVASCEGEHPELSVHKDIGWKDAGSKTNLTTEKAEHIAKFQSFAAPDGEIAQNQTHEEALHIAQYYIDVFNKLVEVNNSTELALYFDDEFKFYTCLFRTHKIKVYRDYFMKFVYNEQANWKLVDAEFLGSNLTVVTLDMNMFGYVEDIEVKLEKQPDESWQWRSAACRLRTCVDPKNT